MQQAPPHCTVLSCHQLNKETTHKQPSALRTALYSSQPKQSSFSRNTHLVSYCRLLYDTLLTTVWQWFRWCLSFHTRMLIKMSSVSVYSECSEWPHATPQKQASFSASHILHDLVKKTINTTHFIFISCMAKDKHDDLTCTVLYPLYDLKQLHPNPCTVHTIRDIDSFGRTCHKMIWNSPHPMPYKVMRTHFWATLSLVLGSWTADPSLTLSISWSNATKHQKCAIRHE